MQEITDQLPRTQSEACVTRLQEEAMMQSKRAVAACMLGLAVLAGVLAEVDESRAFCRAESISMGAKVMQDAYTNAWLDIGNYVCGDQAEETTVVEIDEQVEDVAVAIAEAFAEVSINCRASGNAEVRGTAYALAEQRAVALGNAVTEIFATADVCDSCSATVSALSNTTMVLIAEAVAEAWIDFYLFSDGGVEEQISTVTSDVYVEVVARVLSQITGVIRAGADDGCSIDVINSAQVGDFLARCELFISADPDIEENDAIASAGAEAVAYACNGSIAEAEVTVTARAVARALARAVAQADVFCETVGGEDTIACGLSEANVRAVARAQAEAFATVFARAETCNCNVSISADVEVWDAIWAEAVANAYVETCSVGNGEEFATDFQFAVEERMLVATAVAIAGAVADASLVDGNGCRAGGDVCAATSPQCVSGNSLCGGTDRGAADVLPCCDPDFRCFVRDESRFFCRRRTFRPPRFWDGRIEECTLGLLG